MLRGVSLAFIASASFTRRRISGAKLGTPRNTKSLAFSQRIADAKKAVIRDPNYIPGKGLLGERTILREEELGGGEGDEFSGADQFGAHPALQLSGAYTHERDAIAVIGSIFA